MRRVLQDRRGENRYIETVSGRGYRFVADVKVVEPMPADESAITLAVLPFANLTGDPEREYLADGFTEETIAALAQLDPGHVGVISRTSVLGYKQSADSVDRIGRELGATYLVEGSLHTEAGRPRVTATLVRARDQAPLWTATFDGEPAGVLDLQRELAGVIAQQVRRHFEPSRLAALGYRQTRNAEAFYSHLRGRHYWHRPGRAARS